MPDVPGKLHIREQPQKCAERKPRRDVPRFFLVCTLPFPHDRASAWFRSLRRGGVLSVVCVIGPADPRRTWPLATPCSVLMFIVSCQTAVSRAVTGREVGTALSASPSAIRKKSYVGCLES